MDCDIHAVYLNLRYRILVIGDNQYIIDLGGLSSWRLLFPFFYWIFPISICKIDNPNVVKELMAPEVKQPGREYSSLLGPGIGLFLATLIKPLQNYLSIPSTRFINIVTLSVILIVVCIIFVSINHMFKKKLFRSVDLNKRPREKLWIAPQSFKQVFQTIFLYVFLLALTGVFFLMSIEDPDMISLFITMIVSLVFPFSGFLAITVGRTKVKFINNKKMKYK